MHGIVWSNRLPAENRRCPDCTSTRTSIIESDDGENHLLCTDCGVVKEPKEEEEEKEVELQREFCPHCEERRSMVWCNLEEIWVCNSCNLEPERYYPSESIAHLWKEGSEIQDALKRGKCGTEGSPFSDFVRKECGPHCEYEAICPQESGNFVRCFQEYREDEAMSNRRLTKSQRKQKKREEHEAYKKLNKLTKHQRKQLKKQQATASKKAIVLCAPDGWFKRVIAYDIETDCSKPAEDRRSESGS